MSKVLLITSGHDTSTFDLGIYYGMALKKLGVDAAFFRYDSEISFALGGLRAWRNEPEGEYEGESIYLASKMALADIVMFQPDLVLIVTATTLFPGTLEMMRTLQNSLKCPHRTAIILTESPYTPDEELKAASYANCVFTNERDFVVSLSRIQPEAYYLPHAYCEDVHYPRVGHADYMQDVFFCGSGFVERIAALRDSGLTNMRIVGKFPDLEEMAPELMPYYTEGSMRNPDVAEEYRRSRICLNFHRTTGRRTMVEIYRQNYYYVDKAKATVPHGYSMNNRAVEVAACGAFQLCDSGRREVGDVFGDSVAVFNSADELRDKVGYYLSHDEQRESAALRALAKVQGRTYVNNMRFVLGKALTI